MQMLVWGKRVPAASCGRDHVFKDLAGKRQPGNIQKSLTTKLVSLEEELWQGACNVFIGDLEDVAEHTEKFSDDKQFVHTGARLRLGGIWPGCRRGLTGELMKFNKDKWTPCTWGGLAPCSDTYWRSSQLRREWGPWQTAGSVWDSDKGWAASWEVLTEAQSRADERDLSAFTQLSLDCIWDSIYPILSPQ